jgi:membrane protease YdiL (CAAX protease family)
VAPDPVPPGYGAPVLPYGAYFEPAPAPPRVWTVFVAFAVAFIPGCIATGMVAAVLAVIVHGPEIFSQPEGGAERFEALMREPAIFLPTLLAMQVVLAAVALGAAYLSPVPLRRRLRLGRPRLPWYGYPVVCLGSLALGYSAGVLIELLGFGDQGTLHEFEQAISGMRGPVLVLAAVVVGISPGVGEELMFRGYIQTRLGQRWPRLLAIGVTSLLFALLHMDLVQSTFALTMGLWLGEVADRTGSIWPAAAGHAFNNGVATLGAALLPNIDTWHALAVSVPVFVLCLAYVLCRKVVPPDPEPETPVPAPYVVPPVG